MKWLTLGLVALVITQVALVVAVDQMVDGLSINLEETKNEFNEHIGTKMFLDGFPSTIQIEFTIAGNPDGKKYYIIHSSGEIIELEEGIMYGHGLIIKTDALLFNDWIKNWDETTIDKALNDINYIDVQPEIFKEILIEKTFNAYKEDYNAYRRNPEEWKSSGLSVGQKWETLPEFNIWQEESQELSLDTGESDQSITVEETDYSEETFEEVSYTNQDKLVIV